MFIVPGAVLWSYPQLVVLSWLGSIGAGIVGFSFARYLGRDFVAHRLPKRLHAYDERLVTNGLRTVIFVRMTLFLAPPAHWLLGLSQVRFPAFVLGTAIGFLPGIALLSYVVVFLGESMGDWMAAQPREFWIGIAAAVAAVVVLRRRLRARREAAELALESPPPRRLTSASVDSVAVYRYRPSNLGRRFSTNARTASRWSSVWAVRTVPSAS